MLDVLKSGVLLCYLVRIFSPHSAPQLEEEPQDAGAIRANVFAFLAECEKIGVRADRLFDVNDLVEGRSLYNVVETLYALAEAVEKKWPGKFPSLDAVEMPAPEIVASYYSQDEHEDVARQMTHHLRAAAVKNGEFRERRGWRLSTADKTRELSVLFSQANEGEKIVEKGCLRLRAVFLRNRQMMWYQTRLRESAYRERVVYELLSTEQTYVDSLLACGEAYQSPLERAVQAGRPLVKPKKVEVLFRGMAQIVEVNSKFLVQLEGLVRKWGPNQCLAHVFSALDESFEHHYSAYITNYTEALIVLKREQRKQKAFKDFLSKQKMDPRAKQRELDQFLIMPVQRIPRYHLLLSDLKKHTWSDHPDSEALQAAVERLAKIALSLNEKKRQAEALQRSLHVQDILDVAAVSLTVTTRTYVTEGEMFDAHSSKPVVLYLFSDLLVVCGDRNDRQHTEADERRNNKKKLRYLEHFSLESDTTMSDSGAGLLIEFPWQRRQLSVACVSAQQRKEWNDILRSTVLRLPPQTGAGVPLLVSDEPPRPSGSSRTRGHQRRKSDSSTANKTNTVADPFGTPATSGGGEDAAADARGFSSARKSLSGWTKKNSVSHGSARALGASAALSVDCEDDDSFSEDSSSAVMRDSPSTLKNRSVRRPIPRLFAHATSESNLEEPPDINIAVGASVVLGGGSLSGSGSATTTTTTSTMTTTSSASSSGPVIQGIAPPNNNSSSSSNKGSSDLLSPGVVGSGDDVEGNKKARTGSIRAKVERGLRGLGKLFVDDNGEPLMKSPRAFSKPPPLSSSSETVPITTSMPTTASPMAAPMRHTSSNSTPTSTPSGKTGSAELEGLARGSPEVSKRAMAPMLVAGDAEAFDKLSQLMRGRTKRQGENVATDSSGERSNDSVTSSPVQRPSVGDVPGSTTTTTTTITTTTNTNTPTAPDADDSGKNLLRVSTPVLERQPSAVLRADVIAAAVNSDEKKE